MPPLLDHMLGSQIVGMRPFGTPNPGRDLADLGSSLFQIYLVGEILSPILIKISLAPTFQFH
jgi:hypothetical protein